jgi:hypothetical protein
MANIEVSAAIDNLLKSTPSTAVTTAQALTALGAAVTGTASIVAGDIAANAVIEAKILDGAVTAGKIGALAVTSGKLAVGAAVANIVDNTLPVAKISGLGTAATEDSVQLNVREAPFNAVGDGVADDTEAIQAALNAAGTTSTTRRVYIPAGTYKLTETLVLKNAGTTVIGDGIYSTILNQTTAAAHGFAWDGYTGASGGNAPQACNISHLQINGLGYATHTGSGIYMRRDNGTYITGVSKIEHVLTTGFAHGIRATKFWRLDIDNFQSTNNLVGVWMDGGDTYMITNSSFGAQAIPSGSGTIGLKLSTSNFGGTIEGGEYGDLDCFIENTGHTLTVVEPNVERCGGANDLAAVKMIGSSSIQFSGGRISNPAGNSTRAFFRLTSTIAAGVPTLVFLGPGNYNQDGSRAIEIIGDNRSAARVFSALGRYEIATCLATGGANDYAYSVYTSQIPATGISGLAASASARGQMAFIPSGADSRDHLLATIKTQANTFVRKQLINDNFCQILNDTATVATNTTTGATNLYDYTVPANTIGATKQIIRVTAFGKFAGNANNKKIAVTFAGNTIYDSAALAVNGNDWSLDVTLVYTASGNYSSRVITQCDDALWVNNIQVTKTIARFSNQTGAIVIVGTGGATADIELLYAKTEWMKADSEY